MDVNHFNQNTFIDALVESGEYFGASTIFTVPAGGNYDVLIKTGPKYAHGVLVFKTMQSATMSIYLGGTATSNGTPVVITNFMTFSPKVPGVAMFKSPTMSALGNLGPQYLIPSGSGKGSVGASSENPRHFVLPPNFNVLLRFTDLDAAQVGLRDGQVQLNFYETDAPTSQQRDFI